MRRDLINTLPQLNSLIVNTYIFSVVVALICVALAILVAKLIAWHGGSNDRSYITRRIWFVILWVFSFVSFFIYENFVVMEKITNVAFQSKFRFCMAISCFIIIALYGLVGFVLMKVFRKSKFGSIIG